MAKAVSASQNGFGRVCTNDDRPVTVLSSSVETIYKIISFLRQQMWRFGFALWGVTLLMGLLVSFDDATAQTSVSGVKPVAANAACPATDFAKFLPMFSASPDLQRRYTLFPLKFGLWDESHSRPDDPDEGYKTSMISSFEKIPNYDAKNRTVLPTPLYARKHGLKTEIITIKNSKKANDENVFPEEIVSDPAHVIVRFKVPDTGVNVLYLFKQTNGCWFLYSISDRST